MSAAGRARDILSRYDSIFTGGSIAQLPCVIDVADVLRDLLAELERLQHDVERHMAAANGCLNEKDAQTAALTELVGELRREAHQHRTQARLYRLDPSEEYGVLAARHSYDGRALEELADRIEGIKGGVSCG